MSEKKKVLPKVEIHEIRIPCKGDIVYFVDTDAMMHRPAIITHVWNPQTVNLFVFPDASFPTISNTPTSVSYDPTGHGYTWQWMNKE